MVTSTTQLRLVVTTRAAKRPAEWPPGMAVGWGLLVENSTTIFPDWFVTLNRTGQGFRWKVSNEESTSVCSGPATYDSEHHRYQAIVPRSCLGDPTGLYARATTYQYVNGGFVGGRDHAPNSGSTSLIAFPAS